jgi:hypothetical protein
MKFKYDDGGRAAAGYKGHTGDCVARSIAIASGRPYAEVYDFMAKGNEGQRSTKHSRKWQSSNKRTAAHGIFVQRKWFKDYMRSLGFEWTPTMTIGSGCKVHLHDGELPMGRLVVNVSKHCVAVIDGVIHDTHDPQREIAMFRQFPGWQTADLKPNEHRNQNGIYTISRRCVYGYWRLA